MKLFTRILVSLALAALPAAAQNTLTSTTLATAQTQTATTAVVTSSTGFTVGDALYIDGEVEIVIARNVVAPYGLYAGGTTVPVLRSGSQGGYNVGAHVAGAIVLRGRPSWFQTYNPTGACPTPYTSGGATPAVVFASPLINTKTGDSWRCYGPAGSQQWGKVGVFYVPPAGCTFAPATLTQTTTYPVIGASSVQVANSVTNAAAGTDTLTCNIVVPTDVASGRGSLLTDIVVSLGSQVVAPTSLGTATLGAITFPTPVATTQTASVVTPVALAGGAVTQVGPTTTVLTVTTAGAFLTFSYAFAAPVDMTPDLRLLQFNLPVLQSAASAMTLNTAGLFVHYIHRQ